MCDGTFFFNAYLNKCAASCGTFTIGTTPVPTTAFPESTPASNCNSNSFNCSGKANGLYAISSCCNSFVECYKDQNFIRVIDF